jgi:hypothetical protein
MVYILLMLVGNIVFMNFLIAVVNDSYITCMQSIKSMTYHVKLDIIMEHEKMMSEEDLAK